METLQSTIFIEFDVNTKKITFLRGDNIIDYDSNVTNIYVRVKYKNLTGNTVYLTPSELEDYKFSLYTMKPSTNNVNVITGKVTDELKENVYGGVIKFEIPRVCTNRLGIVKCEIHIDRENKRIGSSTFVLDVKQSLVTAFDDELLGDEDFPVLKQLILEIQKASNIDDSAASSVTTYSGNKIENIKEDLSSQIKDIANYYTNKYYVGENYPYKTITEAFNKWVIDGYPEAEVYIDKGEYNDIISIPQQKNISFFGVSKELTIWRTKSGLYKECPLTARGGLIVCENITFIADHTSNENFNYIGYPEAGTGGSVYQNAYAVHFDGGIGGKYILRNCDLISYQDSALGCGTVNDTLIRLENCNLFSYTDSIDNYPNSSQSLSHGALLYHTYADNNSPTTKENLQLINVNIYSKNSPYPFVYKNYSSDGSKKDLLCVNVNISGDAVTDRINLFQQTARVGSKPFFTLDKNSYNNNALNLNYLNSINLGLSENGYCEVIDDCNMLTKCGFFVCKINTPSSAFYMIHNIVMNDKYTRQIAYNANNAKTYQRECVNGVWDSWQLKIDTASKIQQMINISETGRAIQVDSIDDITVSGYYICKNTDVSAPTRAYYIIHCIIASSSTGIQEAYSLTSTNKYRRYMTASNTWSDWIQVNN